ncbi:MAG: site-specific DNA-methyltransferase [Patescibacteria group bacterium]
MLKIVVGDAREQLKNIPSDSVQTIITSPPYYSLRKYSDSPLEIGREETLEKYIDNLSVVFKECHRILKNAGALFLNIGDKYYPGTKVDGWQRPKQLMLVPQRVAIRLQEDGWVLRNQIAWIKESAAVQPAADRLSPSWEPIFYFAKTETTDFDPYQVGEPLKANTIQRALYDLNRDESTVKDKTRANIRKRSAEKALSQEHPKSFPRDFWKIPVGMTRGDLEHTAIFPIEIPRRCILLSSKVGDTILDPFCGTATTLEAARELDRNGIGIELNEKYLADIKKRLNLNEQLVNEVEIVK